MSNANAIFSTKSSECIMWKLYVDLSMSYAILSNERVIMSKQRSIMSNQFAIILNEVCDHVQSMC